MNKNMYVSYVLLLTHVVSIQSADRKALEENAPSTFNIRSLNVNNRKILSNGIPFIIRADSVPQSAWFRFTDLTQRQTIVFNAWEHQVGHNTSVLECNHPLLGKQALIGPFEVVQWKSPDKNQAIVRAIPPKDWQEKLYRRVMPKAA